MVTRATFSDSVVFWITHGDGAFLRAGLRYLWGVGASILLYLRKAADPHLVEYGFTEEGELQELEKRQRSDLEISSFMLKESFSLVRLIFLESRFADFVRPKLEGCYPEDARNARHLDATSCMAP